MEHQAPTKQAIPELLPEQPLSELELRMTHLITHAYQEEQEAMHIQTLSEGLIEVVDKAVGIGDLAHRHLLTRPQARLEDYLITFDWAERIKHILRLWRDVLFEEHKTLLMVSDGDASLEQFRQQKTDSRDLLFRAIQDVHNYIDATKAVTPDHEVLQETWYLQKNPWPAYQTQLEALKKHAEELQAQFKALWNSSGAYVVINTHFSEAFKNFLDKFQKAKDEISLLSISFQNNENPEKVNIVQQLEGVTQKVVVEPNRQTFTNILVNQLSKLPGKTRINVDVDGGKLLYKDLNFRQSTNEWIESEVMSEIYETYQIGENMHSRLNLAIENIKNLIQNERLEEQPFPKDDIIQILQNLNKNLDKSSERIIELRNDVEKQLGKTLGVSRVFQDDFLTLSFQSTINQYRRYQIEWWEKLKLWIKKQSLFIQRYRQQVREEEVMSISEKIVRVVRQRTLPPEEEHYDNIFLTNGYIGDSFTVGREQEMDHIAKQVENWKLGYRGALLISGKRFSGKTLIGQLVSQKLFKNQTISLQPDSRIVVNGRPYVTTYDLGATLDFVLKYTSGGKAIWIDNLEFWQDDKITLSENVRALCRTIDLHSGKLFFMVSMSNGLREELSHWYDINRVFQSEINVDKMNIENARKAVLLRHSATHVQMVDEEGEELTAAALEKIVTRLYRMANGNIGEVLHLWAVIMDYKDDYVRPKDELIYQLPDFLSPDIAILLRTIMIERKTNEYRLRKTLGPAFRTVYKPILQRGLNLGMIIRNVNGWLEINPMVVNEVGKQLDKYDYFDYDGIKGFS